MSNSKELRVQHCGRPYRVLYAFDPRREALLLVAGDERGSERWYRRTIRVAERIWERHLAQREEPDGQVPSLDRGYARRAACAAARWRTGGVATVSNVTAPATTARRVRLR